MNEAQILEKFKNGLLDSMDLRWNTDWKDSDFGLRVTEDIDTPEFLRYEFRFRGFHAVTWDTKDHQYTESEWGYILRMIILPKMQRRMILTALKATERGLKKKRKVVKSWSLTAAELYVDIVPKIPSTLTEELNRIIQAYTAESTAYKVGNLDVHVHTAMNVYGANDVQRTITSNKDDGINIISTVHREKVEPVEVVEIKPVDGDDIKAQLRKLYGNR